MASARDVIARAIQADDRRLWNDYVAWDDEDDRHIYESNADAIMAALHEAGFAVAQGDRYETGYRDGAVSMLDDIVHFIDETFQADEAHKQMLEPLIAELQERF